MNKVHSLYIHFPFCRHLCNYCDFFKHKVDPNAFDPSGFEFRLEQSFQEHKDLLLKNGFGVGDLSTLYLGGGTPSLWGESGARFLDSLFSENDINLKDDCEITLEVNPGTWTEKGIHSWVNFGVNRFSLGVQSFNPKYQRYLDRIHTHNDVLDTLEFFRSLGLNYSVDFMLGLPFSEQGRDIEKELYQILEFNPNHLSLYILTTGADYIHSHALPNDDWVSSEYLTVAKVLKDNGFGHYEVSNYSKPGFESKHNYAYWNQDSVAALGPSATGFLSFGDKGVRYKWDANYRIAEEDIDNEKFRLEKLFLNLRTSEGLELKSFFSLDELKSHESFISKLVQDDLAFVKDGRLTLSSKGFLVQDSILDGFL